MTLSQALAIAAACWILVVDVERASFEVNTLMQRAEAQAAEAVTALRVRMAARPCAGGLSAYASSSTSQ